MNRLNITQQTQIIRCLVEGNSLNATARITGRAINTVIKLLCTVGVACLEYQDKFLVNLPCRYVQCDEIWSFCYAKDKNLPPKKKGKFGYGGVWTWIALCADTKLIISWTIGNRDAKTADLFIRDLALRLSHKIQLSTDGLKFYLDAVEKVFGADIDYAMLVKNYGERHNEDNYVSTEASVFAEQRRIAGKPDSAHISTNYVERQNLTMRMGMRRFTRKTNGFSKKLENMICAIALHFMYYNFGRLHTSLRITPAMEIGLTDHIWEIEEILKLTEKTPELQSNTLPKLR